MDNVGPKTGRYDSALSFKREKSAKGLLKSLLSDHALRKKHKQSLWRIKIACDDLESESLCIEAEAVVHQIRMQFGRRAAPTETGISSNKNTLLLYIQLRRKEQIQAAVQHDSRNQGT